MRTTGVDSSAKRNSMPPVVDPAEMQGPAAPSLQLLVAPRIEKLFNVLPQHF